MTKAINFQDPEVKKLLRKVAEEQKSDPFTLDRLVCHLRSGIVSLDDLRGKPSS